MKFRQVSFFAVLVLIGASCNYGGLHSFYRARDGDPLLTTRAREALPIIQAADSYIEKHHRIPSIEDLHLPPSPSVSYMPESNSYLVYVSLGWDPTLFYSSEDKSWTFDPGDGHETKVVRLSP